MKKINKIITIIMFSSVMLFPAIISAEKRWINIEGDLKTGAVINTLKDGWEVHDSGDPQGVDKVFTYNNHSSSATPSGWRGEAEEILNLNISAKPSDRLSLNLSYEMVGNYADRLWQPISDEKRMELSGNKFKWVKGKFDYTNSMFRFYGFKGYGQPGWTSEDNDMFGFYPEQWEVDQYRRITGRIVPEGGKVEWGNNATGTVQYIAGRELRWGYRDNDLSQYVKINKKIKKIDVTAFYKREQMPYGKENEVLNAWQLSFRYRMLRNTYLKLGCMYQPFRLNQAYNYVEDVKSGSGLLGSSYRIKESVTDNYDAWAEAIALVMHPRPIVDNFELGYTHAGILAGNKDEYTVLVKRSLFSRAWAGSVRYTYVKPVIGPMPLLQDQVGAILSSPRGEDAPFRVSDDPFQAITSGNREKDIYTIVFTFDPTRGTRLFQYRDDVVADWNINPAEDALYASAFQGTWLKYTGSTDNQPYFDEHGDLTFVPAHFTGMPSGRQYMPSLLWVNIINLPLDYTGIISLGGGQMPATTILADERNKNYTNYLTSRIALRKGPWFGSLAYERDTWGPESYHQAFGQIIDRLLKSKVSYDFTDSIYATGEYIYARRIENKIEESSLGSFNEIRLMLGIRFGVLLLIDEYKKPVKMVDIQEPAALSPSVSVDYIIFSPDGDHVDDTLPIGIDIMGGPVASWEVTIRDSQDTIINNFSGFGSPPNRIVWDGMDQNFNETVSEDTYTIQLRATDENNSNYFASPVEIKVRY